jgi:predicted MFS family arabinose efflux permease
VAGAESGTSPASQSIISSLFPRSRLTFALCVLMSANCLGTLIAFVVGGQVAARFYWRNAFFIVSAPGLLLCALLAMSIPRLRRAPASGPTGAGLRFWNTARFLWSRPSYRNTSIAYSLYMTSSYSVLLWTPAMLTRSFGIGSTEVGWIMGMAVGVVALAGSLILGWITQRLAIRDMRWNLWAVGLAAVIATPFMWAMLMTTSLPLFLLIGLAPLFVFHFHTGTSLTVIQSLAPTGMKSEASAIALLISSVISGSLGPFLAGVLSDVLHPYVGAQSLRYVFLLFSLCWPAAAWFYWRASQTLNQDLARVEDPS